MYTDLFGVNRLKINLHTHTTQSDGALTPEQAAEHYRSAGYDAIAVTDHWRYTPSGTVGGLRFLSGMELNLGGGDGASGVFHIVALGCTEAPATQRGDGLQKTVDDVHAAGGLAVLAHPAWSLNRISQIRNVTGLEATEIFNGVSDAGESARAYSDHFVDACGCEGIFYPLLAVDDAHYYKGQDDLRGWIMLEGSLEDSDAQLLESVRRGRFYATQGPEVHLRVENGVAVADCSEVSSIRFFSNLTWGAGHRHDGENLTHAECRLSETETFIRAEVVDREGKKAWTNPVRIK